MSKYEFSGIASTTHKDRHGEQVTREFLEYQVAMFKEGLQPMWGYWNHFTTLPPIIIITDQEVEKREDREYQLVIKGDIFEEGYFDILLQTDIVIPEITKQDISETIQVLPSSNSDILQIRYDPRNFNSSEVDPIINSINKLIPTKREYHVRKSEMPQAIVFVSFALATGFVSRFGEIAADKAYEKASSFYGEFASLFSQLLKKSKTTQKPDVIIDIPIQNSDVIVEGAIEEADMEILKRVWEKLPELYCFAEKIIDRNREDYFSQLKFLFNPETEMWEVNYILTQATNRVILGSRYINLSHPLYKRWDIERKNYTADNKKGMGMSLGFIPK